MDGLDPKKHENTLEASVFALQDWAQTHDVHDNERHTEIIDEIERAKDRDVKMKALLERMQTDMKSLATKEDMEEIKPLLQAMAGSKLAITYGRTLYKVFVFIGSIALAYVAIRQVLSGNF